MTIRHMYRSLKRQEPLKFSSTDLVYYYGYLLGQLQYEGAGIWNRFNIMITLNGSLLGLVAFAYEKVTVQDKYLFLLFFSIIGLLFSIWSLYVLKKLWIYHYHWKDKLADVELLFPKNIPTPISGIKPPNKDNGSKRNREIKAWLYSYTQPFFIMLMVLWLIFIFTNKIFVEFTSNFNITHIMHCFK